mgnify:CR=1 FL=1
MVWRDYPDQKESKVNPDGMDHKVLKETRSVSLAAHWIFAYCFSYLLSIVECNQKLSADMVCSSLSITQNFLFSKFYVCMDESVDQYSLDSHRGLLV